MFVPSTKIMFLKYVLMHQVLVNTGDGLCRLDVLVIYWYFCLLSWN